MTGLGNIIFLSFCHLIDKVDFKYNVCMWRKINLLNLLLKILDVKTMILHIISAFIHCNQM